MGGHDHRDPARARTPVIVAAEFALVISLYTREGHGPGGPLTATQIEALCQAAELATNAVARLLTDLGA